MCGFSANFCHGVSRCYHLTVPETERNTKCVTDTRAQRHEGAIGSSVHCLLFFRKKRVQCASTARVLRKTFIRDIEHRTADVHLRCMLASGFTDYRRSRSSVPQVARCAVTKGIATQVQPYFMVTFNPQADKAA